MTLAVISLVLAAISAFIIFFDMKKNPQSMRIMHAVWILTALWASVFGLIAYYWFGREKKMQMPAGAMDDMPMQMPNRPAWQSVTLSALHCGAGCTLADIVGSILLFVMPITLFGSTLVGGWTFTFILALLMGVYFQFAAIREMENLPIATILKRAIKADFLSLTSWQVGMYCWMYYLMFHLHYITPNETWTWQFWFAMQQAMLAGLVLALPMNYILIKAGVKSGM